MYMLKAELGGLGLGFRFGAVALKTSMKNGDIQRTCANGGSVTVVSFEFSF